MKIVIAPDPELRRVCDPVDAGDPSIVRIAKQMAKVMYRNSGCGLAAPQVGIHKRFIVFDCDVDNEEPTPVLLINPEIVDHGDEIVKSGEGCLSIPGLTLEIPRWDAVRVTGLDGNFEEVVFEAEGDLLCRCLQHEIDHLNGMTMFERLDPVSRIAALREYQYALEHGARPGDVEVRA